MDGVIRDFGCSIHYYPGKASVVDDAGSRESAGRLSCVCCARTENFNEMEKDGGWI